MRRPEESQIVFERLYREFGPDVLAFCRRRVDAEVADDVMAETFLVAWRRLPEVPRSPRGWLLGIARLTLANQWRSVRRRDALLERMRFERCTEDIVADPGQVIEALSWLSELDQEALLLSAWDGLSSREAAQVLGCTPVAFRLRLHRARRRLERVLAADTHARPLRLPKDRDGVRVAAFASRENIDWLRLARKVPWPETNICSPAKGN